MNLRERLIDVFNQMVGRHPTETELARLLANPPIQAADSFAPGAPAITDLAPPSIIQEQGIGAAAWQHGQMAQAARRLDAVAKRHAAQNVKVIREIRKANPQAFGDFRKSVTNEEPPEPVRSENLKLHLVEERKQEFVPEREVPAYVGLDEYFHLGGHAQFAVENERCPVHTSVKLVDNRKTADCPTCGLQVDTALLIRLRERNPSPQTQTVPGRHNHGR
jgi:hypothetical protein